LRAANHSIESKEILALKLPAQRVLANPAKMYVHLIQIKKDGSILGHEKIDSCSCADFVFGGSTEIG
jgi:hypothetical protein